MGEEKGDKTTILIVENSEEVLWSVSNVIAVAGFDISAVSTGLEALEALKRISNIRVVIIDYLLPDMSGIELLKRIRKSECNVQVIAMSSYSQIREYFMENGAYAFLEKPFDINELVRTCRYALSI